MTDDTECQSVDRLVGWNSLKFSQDSQEEFYPAHGGQVPSLPKGSQDEKRWLDFSVSINPLGPSRRIEQVWDKSMVAISKYPDSNSSELKQALSDYLKTEESRIVVTNGATDLIYLLPHLMNRGKELLVLVPIFSEYQRAFKLSKFPVQTLAYDIGKEFEAPMEKLINVLNENPNTGAVALGHPNSPTGRLWDRQSLIALADICESRGIFLIIDETFVEFCDPGSSALEWSGNFPHLILVRSMTKFFALPGLRLGYGVMDPKWIQVIEKFRPPWSVNSMAQEFGLASIADQPYIKKSQTFIRKQRDFLMKHLKDMPQLRVYPSDANFILFQLMDRQEHEIRRFYTQLLQDGFVVRNCGNFEGLNSSFFRICVRNREDNKSLLSKIRNFLS